MKILQQPISVKRHSRVHVHFSRPCTVYLMTEVNFRKYKDGGTFTRLGGEFEKSPAEFVAPYDGTWHAVIEKGGSHHNPQHIEGRVEVKGPKMKDIPYLSDIDKDLKNHEIEAEQVEEIIDSSEEISEEENEESEEDQDEEKD